MELKVPHLITLLHSRDGVVFEESSLYLYVPIGQDPPLMLSEGTRRAIPTFPRSAGNSLDTATAPGGP